MSDKSDNEKRYFIVEKTSSKLVEQMVWTEEAIKKENYNEDKHNSFSLRKGFVYKYIKRISSNNRIIYGFCVVLADSAKYDSHVLICPIYPFMDSINKISVNIGVVPQLDGTCEIIGSLCEINFASKTRFILNKENDIEPVPVCYLNKDQYLKLLLSYKDFICAIVKSNSTIRVSYRNQDNEMAYTC